ncbi:MAG: molybdenum ABC transporter permease [Planctomycetaceae bacterium]|nr:molybdenum ABC transporter permease [Planctomycetaceae bacterium]MBP61862.1 molybdenum ABC transporter permease [Planctomycetaceae bacterium]
MIPATPIDESSASRVPQSPGQKAHRVGSDLPFYAGLIVLGGAYLFLLLAMLIADLFYTSPGHLLAALGKPAIQYSIGLSLISCSITALLSLWVAVPIGYLLARHRFRGHSLVDAILDIPIVLPPLVVGLSLLILFQFWPFRLAADWVVYQIPAVILAQFMVACAFATRTLRTTFDQIDPRCEQVALTLGCSRAQAFASVVLPEARRGIITAATLAWARSLGEFGPLLIFAGATRMKTEVLSTTVFLELSVGDLEAAVAVSMIMIVAAVVVLMIARIWGSRDLTL